MRVVPRKSLVEARPVELWHLEIAQDEVVRFGAQLLQGGAAVGRDVHAVVVEPEKIRQRLRAVGLMVPPEDGLALTRRKGLEGPCFGKSRRYGDRQLDAKDRALSRPAVDLNRPSVSDDDRPAQPEPQAGPVPWRLRREEGLENSRLDLRGDPGARVGDLEPYAFFLSTGPRRHGHPTPASPSTHGVMGVGDEIHDHLVKLCGSAQRTGRSAASWSLTSDRKSTRLNSSHLVISYAVF